MQSSCFECMRSSSRAIYVTFLIFFHLESVESLKNISGNEISEISHFLDHQHDVVEGVIQRAKQSSHHHVRGNVFNTERNQIICESSESAVYGVDFLSLISLESVEFASESVNSGIFLSGNSFSNLLK